MSAKLSFNFEGKSDKGILISPAKISEAEWFCDNSPAGFARIYKSSDIVYITANDAMWKMLGYISRAGFVREMTKNAALPVSEDDLARINAELEKLSETVKSVKLIVSLIRADGSTFYAACTFTYNKENRKTYLCVLAENIDEFYKELLTAKKSEMVSKERFKYFACLTDDLPCGIIQFKAKYPYNVYTNGRTGSGYNLTTLSYFSYPTLAAFDKVAKSKFRNLIYNEDRDKFIVNVKSVIDYSEKTPFEMRIIRYDGSVGCLSGTLIKTRTFVGDDIVQFVFIDITEKLEAQNKIIEQNKQIKCNEARITAIRDSLEDIMKNLPSGVSVYEVTNGVSEMKYISDNVYEVFGYSVGDGEIPEMMKFENVTNYPGDAQSFDSGEEIEYIRHTKNKSGNEIYVRFNVRHIENEDGFKVYYVSVMNVTDRIIAEREEEKRNALYRLLLNDTDEMLFEYNAETGTLTYSCRDASGMRVNSVNKNFRDELRLGTGTVHPDMCKNILSVFVEAAKRPRDGSIDYMAKRNSDTYRWYRAYYKSVENKEQQTYTVIGRSTDIQSEVEEMGSLKEQISLDLLTKIYNRITGEKYIREKLSSARENDKYAFFIIDIDNFKSFNDTFGHPVGDTIIKETASVIKNASPRDCVASRFGGDEFTLFFKYKSDEDYLSKARYIVEEMKKTSASLGISMPITVSVGVSLYPKDGASFDELFSKADRAMYGSKLNGKNSYTLFTEENQ